MPSCFINRHSGWSIACGCSSCHTTCGRVKAEAVGPWDTSAAVYLCWLRNTNVHWLRVCGCQDCKGRQMEPRKNASIATCHSLKWFLQPAFWEQLATVHLALLSRNHSLSELSAARKTSCMTSTAAMFPTLAMPSSKEAWRPPLSSCSRHPLFSVVFSTKRSTL